MTYVPTIPQSTDLQSISQGNILTNFTQLGTIFSANHYALDYATVALRGMHKFLTLENQAAAPSTTSTQCALYAKSDGTNPQLYLRRASSGTEVQMSAIGDPIAATSGQTFLPGGLILKWGQFTMSGTSATISYAGVAYPTNTLMVSICPLNTAAASSTYRVGSWTPTTFNIHTTSVSSAQFTYIAIGS